MFPVFGALLALGSPIGLLLLHAVLMRQLPTLSWVLEQLRRQPVTYSYLTMSTTLVFASLGWLLGRQHDRLLTSSLTDPLTGLANRRDFDARVHDDLLRAARHGSPLSMLVIDVDRLKDLNDVHGHAAGDEALRRVAEAIRGTCRRTDIAARYGGDEFAVLAPFTSGSEGVGLAQRICNALLAANREGAPVSVSIGVAELTRLPVTGLGPGELYGAADRALYRAKALGRNCVAWDDSCMGEIAASSAS